MAATRSWAAAIFPHDGVNIGMVTGKDGLIY